MAKNQFSGVPQMIAKIEAVLREYPKQVEAALFAEAQIEVTEMKRRTPVDTTPNAPHPGNLRNGIHAEEPVWQGRRVYVLVATSTSAPYAIYVHENPDAYHPIGQWKYMESVINESRAYMAARVAARLKI